MPKIDIFYQTEVVADIGHCELEADETFAALKALLCAKHGIAGELLLFLEDSDYTGDYEVAIFAGTVGGAAVKEVGRHTVAAGWQTLSVELPTTGAHFVYLEILEPGPKRMAWSAPIWITRP